MPPSRLAELLLRKAGQDEFAVRKLIDDPKSPDEIIGFHAQQAVEKLLKAVLASQGVRFRKTHDIVELIDLIRDHGLTFPHELEEARTLTPFATDFRYEGFTPGFERSFDRWAALRCLSKVQQWAESTLKAGPAS